MGATQESVPELSKRDQQYEALIASREAEREAEVPGQEEEQAAASTEEQGQEEEQAPEQKPTVKFTDDDGVEYEIPASARMRLKVDGAEIDEPLDRMTRGYQKGAAADKRLEMASTKQRELETREQELIRRGNALSQQEQAALAKLQEMEQSHEAGRLSTDAYRLKAEELVSALLDDEDPVSKVAKILPSLAPQQQQIDLGRLQSDLKTTIRSEMELDEARGKFYETYDDLASDSSLHHLVNERTKELVAANPNAKPWAIIKEAAEDVRAWQKKFVPETERVTAKPTPTPRAASGRASIGKDAPPPQTREDVLNDMRKMRGQPLL
jgi:hypothetical protein